MYPGRFCKCEGTHGFCAAIYFLIKPLKRHFHICVRVSLMTCLRHSGLIVYFTICWQTWNSSQISNIWIMSFPNIYTFYIFAQILFKLLVLLESIHSLPQNSFVVPPVFNNTFFIKITKWRVIWLKMQVKEHLPYIYISMFCQISRRKT